jgi:hypothetical protein
MKRPGPEEFCIDERLKKSKEEDPFTSQAGPQRYSPTYPGVQIEEKV